MNDIILLTELMLSISIIVQQYAAAYIGTSSGVTVKYQQDGRIATCKQQ